MIMAALGIAQSVFGFMSASRIAKAQARFEEAKARSQERIRLANNEFEAARATLAEWQRTRANQKLLERGGEERAALEQNFNRNMDSLVRGGIADKIRSAEELGKIAATSGAFGVGGSTIQVIKDTTMRVNAIQEQEKLDNVNYARYDFRNQRSAIMANTVLSLDENINIANMNQEQAIAQYVPKPSVANLLFNVAGSLIGQRAEKTERLNTMTNNVVDASVMSIDKAVPVASQLQPFRPFQPASRSSGSSGAGTTGTTSRRRGFSFNPLNWFDRD